MRLLKLVLHKYTRLRLNMIETIVYEPVAPTQFIIGTNGSGKSSLIHECSPLVPDKNDYEKGGYKHVVFDLEGAVYELRSDFADGQHHSFKRDGKELNEGGTVTVQNELVKQYFRYTPEIHAMVIGENNFTRMNSSERKRWFTMLANANYDYAVGVFKRVTERYNETRHALKRNKDRLVVESAKLLPAEQLEQLRNECSDMYVRVQRLIEQRQPLLEPAAQLVGQSEQLTKALEGIAKDVRQIIKRLSKDHPRNLQVLRDAVVAQKQQLIHLQQQADQYFADYERMQQLWEAMQASHLENAAQIQTEITSQEQVIKEAQAHLQITKAPLHDAATTIASCDKLLAWWPTVQNHLHDNREKNWGRAMFQTLVEEIHGISQRYEQAKSLRDRAIQTIEHHESHSSEASVDCPKCHHKFQPNFSALTLEDAKRRQREMAASAETLEKELATRQELRDQIQNYFTNYTVVVQQVRNAPGMEGFYDWMAAENLLLHSPKLFTIQLQRYRDEAGKWVQINAAQTRINQARSLAEQLQARENATGGKGVQAERERLEKLVGDCEFKKQTAHSQLQQLQYQLQLLEQMNINEQKLREGLQRIDHLHAQAADSLRREVFAQMLRELQSQLAFKEQALMAAERQQSVIEHIESEIATLTSGASDLKLLQQELSPTEGLIAEGIFGFMRTFVEQMNQTIDMLFSYPLKVQPCSTESGESLNLTYKFPLMVDGKLRQDVARGSSGMREVIDLAFRIAAMKALGIGHYPLFLDEFGRTLDPVHKQASVAMIASVMELEHFEQVFLISHDVVQYSGIGKSEIVVLHEANVQLPPNCSYNTNCKFN